MTSDTYFQSAIDGIRSGNLPAGYIDAMKRDREERRAFWSSEYGRKELKRLLAGSGVFSAVDSEWTEEMKGRRNQIVELLDDMGLLDEANLDRLLAYMLSLPAVPEWVEEELKNGR